MLGLFGPLDIFYAIQNPVVNLVLLSYRNYLSLLKLKFYNKKNKIYGETTALVSVFFRFCIY